MKSRRLTGKWYLRKRWFGLVMMVEVVRVRSCPDDVSFDPEVTMWEKAEPCDFAELGVMAVQDRG
jgi:hypothetical protein